MDFVNFTASERVDLADLNDLSETVSLGLSQETLAYFAENPNAQTPASVVSGFATSNPTGNQIQVTRGVALLGQRQGLSVVFGTLACTGDATQAIDVSTFEAGTYGVYITYILTPSKFENRTFWQPSGTPGEYAQNVSTRLSANWSMTVVAGTPGPEWLQVASLTLPGNVLTDTRPLYFEGRPDEGYASGWGSADDRNPQRNQAAVGDMHTFTKAMRQAIEDVKGPGLTRWWEELIGGQNIGFAGTPTLGRTCWTDANFFAQGSASSPGFVFDGSSTLGFNRAAQTLFCDIGGVNALTLGQTSLTVQGSLGIGTAATSALTLSAIGAPQALFDASIGSAAAIKIQARTGTTSVLLAPGGTATVFEIRGTSAAPLSFLDTFAQGSLASRIDSSSRFIFGPSSTNYAYPTSPATLSIADTTGNTHLRLDASALSGVAATLSLRANNAAAVIRFTPSATTTSSAASFALQAAPTAFSLMDSVNGNAVFTYTPANRVLDFTTSSPTANAYNIATAYQSILYKANIYQWVIPSTSQATAGVGPSGGFTSVNGTGAVFFPLQVPASSTFTSLILSTIRFSPSSSAYNVSVVLYGSLTGSSGSQGATALASVVQSIPSVSSGYKINITIPSLSVATASYQNFYVAFTDTDTNATNYIFSLTFRASVASLPVGNL